MKDGYRVLADPGLASDPWLAIEQLVQARPAMVELQPIRPRPDGRSFASTSGFTPFHTDSQDYLGVSPDLQVMICRKAAARGGESRLLDGDALLARLARDQPALHHALHTVVRTHRFYFGEVVGPTVAAKQGYARVWTHSPLPPTDDVGLALARELEREPVIEIPVQTGQILLVDNHRMLHGRNAFADDDREFVRLLAWTYAEERRLRVVLELLAGTPPAKLAAREGITEAELYAWRSRALGAARDALR